MPSLPTSTRVYDRAPTATAIAKSATASSTDRVASEKPPCWSDPPARMPSQLALTTPA